MDKIWVLALILLVYFAFRFISKNDKSAFRKMAGAYIIWAFVNLVLLVSSDRHGSDFWPFDGLKWVNEYDFSEFLVYVGGPLVYIYARRFFSSDND